MCFTKKKDFHLSTQFRWKNGYAISKDKPTGIGNAPMDVDSLLYAKPLRDSGYDPTLTYGVAKDPQKPMVESNFVALDGKCLSFTGYTKETIPKPSVYPYRIRHVKIIYYLVDDTISITERTVENAGYPQGCVLRRGLIPNPHRKNRTWHWSDMNIGVELSFYGVTYRLCSCDQYTRQYLSSLGVAVGPGEPVPEDPYTVNRERDRQRLLELKFERSFDDVMKFKQFLENDGKVLRFYAVWDDEITEPPEWKYFVLMYFLADDRVKICESRDSGNTTGRVLSPQYLNKIKLPKDLSSLPSDFPTVYLDYLEAKDDKFQDYYKPKDFIIGNTIFVLTRRFFIYDCDRFTREYFKDVLGIVQPDPFSISERTDVNRPIFKDKVIPPYTGIGDPDDTRQNCLSLMPKPAKTLDFVTYVLNASKKLRYKLKLVPVYDVDVYRNFIMEFCLGNDHIVIVELAGKNNGFVKGRLMASARLRKPNTNVDDNLFYGTKDFAIGAELHVRGSVFKIVALDLWTYKYMVENNQMFTPDAIDGAKSFLESEGLLKTPENETPSEPNDSKINRSEAVENGGAQES